MPKMSYSGIGLLIISIIFGTIGQLLLKNGVVQIGPSAINKTFFIKCLFNISIIGGLMLYALSAILWLVILTKIPMTIAYPMLSMSYILVVILAAVIYKEPITIRSIIGVLLIMGGVVILGTK